jgi:hypothetical protein
LRLNNQTNAIDTILKGTKAENMHTDDFTFYMGDIAAGQVQYGKRTEMCSYLLENAEKKPKEFFPELVA